jgi:hypothetical protein
MLKQSSRIKPARFNKCISLPAGNCYITFGINYMIHIFPLRHEKIKQRLHRRPLFLLLFDQDLITGVYFKSVNDVTLNKSYVTIRQFYKQIFIGIRWIITGQSKHDEIQQKGR